MVISKDIKFDCAHMLSNYEGKCANLHGHTYHGTVTLTGDVDPETSMLLDYNRIKEIVDIFDHAIIFSSPDMQNEAESKLCKWAMDYGMKYAILPTGKSTAERIARYLASTFIQQLGVTRVHVNLSETDGSWATAEAYK